MSFEHPLWEDGGWRDHGDAGAWNLGRTPTPAEDALVLERPILVTAFGSFPGQPVNPSELVVDELAGDEAVVGHVLDVSYGRATDQLDGMVRMLDPSAVVCFGVARSASTVRLELVARNRDASETEDVDGEVRTGRRIDTGPDALPTRLDVDGIAARLTAASIPFERSQDAGGYVCNHVFRHALTHVDLLDRPVGLVHVPQFRSPGFDTTRYGEVGRTVVAAVLDGLVPHRTAV